MVELKIFSTFPSISLHWAVIESIFNVWLHKKLSAHCNLYILKLAYRIAIAVLRDRLIMKNIKLFWFIIRIFILQNI